MDKVELVDVPKLPWIGSLISKHSGISKVDFRNVYNSWYQNRIKFGHFYNIGLPHTGKGIYRDTYILTDPNEFMKILRREGSYPYGPTSIQWPIVKYYNDANEAGSPGASAGAGLFSVGPEWQKYRRFMQSDLLHPSAAKGYLSGLIKASQMASQGAPLHATNIAEYMVICSFDMFSSVAFGEFPGLASGKHNDGENRKFCESTLASLTSIFPLMLNPIESLKKSMGIKTELYTKFETNLSQSRKIAHEKIKHFGERKANGDLKDEFEKMSYANQAIDRYLATAGQEDAVNAEEAAEMIVMGLIAALDTTSAVLNWTTIHLALNPEVQEELYKEVSQNVAEAGVGGLTDSCFTKSNNVYLDALLRENHRMTPPVVFNVSKENVTDDVEIHGRTIPKGNKFTLDSRSIGMDPSFVRDPDTFAPSRWFEKEVAQRKGTPAEVLEHPLYRAPFSAGARKCPGSRVANYETKVMLSQLVLDWKISFADNSQQTKPKSWRDIEYFQGLTIQPKVPELSFERRQ